MNRFAQMLAAGFSSRGHDVHLCAPEPRLHRLLSRVGISSKWAGYVDQYLLFPWSVRFWRYKQPPSTIFVFCDQALGPWVPLVEDRPHVVHVHDLLALRSALGEFPENPTGAMGRIYQRYIRHGFRRARHFISISNKSSYDLHTYGGVSSDLSEVIYNGLNYPYEPLEDSESRRLISEAGLADAPRGMLLYVGSNSWYKNLKGVIRIYASYVRRVSEPLPLWLVTSSPSDALQEAMREVPPAGQILIYSGVDNRTLQAVYSRARALVMPSLAEGFGWPLLEALACGCPVITTDEAPMNEVVGPVGYYLPRLTAGDDVLAWAENGASVVEELLSLTDEERSELVSRGLEWAGRFSTKGAIDAYLNVYQRVLEMEGLVPVEQATP